VSERTGRRSSARSILVAPDAGERIASPLGGEVVFKARGAQTNGSLTVFEAVNPPGLGPPYHVHSSLDELIYVVEGTIRIRLDDDVEDAPAGAFVFIPRGTPHTWDTRGDHDSRILVVLAPAGLEALFDNTAAAGSDDAVDAFRRFGGNDLTVVGPPLAVSHPVNGA
jgi:quercetin dioxygenase-like cupin family protein